MANTVRLYGWQRDGTSWARVTAGCMSGLVSIGELAGYVATDEPPELGAGLPAGYDAPVGALVGPPGSAAFLSSGNHRERMILIAPNSTWLPAKMADGLKQHVTGVIGPSKWACEILRSHMKDIPVYLWRHGVSDAFKPEPKYIQARADELPHGMRCVHFTSTKNQRKGTEELLLAWEAITNMGALPDGSSLLVMAEPPLGDLSRLAGRSSRVSVVPPLRLSDVDMCRFLQQFHVCVQPSRGEGFGLLPLEALASGVPVCATNCTGHSGHVQGPGVDVIKSGELAPIDDGPGAMDPTVEPGNVAGSLVRMFQNWQVHAAGANAMHEKLLERWSWSATTREFLGQLGEAPKEAA